MIALRVCRRSGSELLKASRADRRAAARRRPGGRRAPGPATLPDTEPGDVRVLVTDGAIQEAAVVADTLRRAHLMDGVPWSRMAVLVRSATRQVPLLRRALVAAGVPVVVGGGEVPMPRSRACGRCWLMLRSRFDRGDPRRGAGGGAADRRRSAAPT